MTLSQVVSLRLSSDELEYLKSQQIDGESFATTIKRLAFDKTSKPKKEDTTHDQIEQLKQELKSEILEAVNELIEPLRDVIIEDREKLERVANTVNDILECSESASTVNTVNIVNKEQQDYSFEDMTKNQLKTILNESGIKYSSKSTHAELVSLCKTKNFGKGY